MENEIFRKAFVPEGKFKEELGDVYQVEARIYGEITRLQSEGPFPEDCFFSRRHSGLKLLGILESYPPIYEVGCDCGYKARLHDVNTKFERKK